jgi:hypothetical protein
MPGVEAKRRVRRMRAWTRRLSELARLDEDFQRQLYASLNGRSGSLCEASHSDPYV